MQSLIESKKFENRAILDRLRNLLKKNKVIGFKNLPKIKYKFI